MPQRSRANSRFLVAAAFIVALGIILGVRVAAQHASEQRDMALVGHDDLQARSAYQPTIQRQGNRWIAYIGHHGGMQRNPLTGKDEQNGTSIVDVTDPKKLSIARTAGMHILELTGSARRVANFPAGTN